MDVREIVRRYLKNNGFDGVYNVDNECCCSTEHFPTCGNDTSDCVPGYRMPCSTDYCDGLCAYHIGPTKNGKRPIGGE